MQKLIKVMVDARALKHVPFHFPDLGEGCVAGWPGRGRSRGAIGGTTHANASST
jgi:hypothetical protein